MTERQQDIIANTFLICFVGSLIIAALIASGIYLAYNKVKNNLTKGWQREI